MDAVTLLKAVLLGLVEGLTEFAPVSSTGHMIIVDDMWLQSEAFLTKYVANTFKVVIQLGSILAVVVVFRDRFVDLLGLRRWFGNGGKGGRFVRGAGIDGRAGRNGNGNEAEGGRAGARAIDGAPSHAGHASGDGGAAPPPRLKLAQVIVGLLPAGVVGVLFENYIDDHLFTTETVLVGLVIGALLMIAADRFRPKQPLVETVDRLTYKQALTIGLIQCLSLWPGFSRSGATISGGVLLGLSHRAAADFTFIMAVPIMFGASLLSLVKNLEYFTMEALPFFVVGFVSAFVFALVSIRFFLKLINRVKLVPFALYRLVLAAVIALVYF